VYLTGFPDLQTTVEDLVAEGEKVVGRWAGRATHSGPFMNIPPTGKQVTVAGIAIVRLEGGKIVEEWVNFDALGMMQQLGVIPPMG
jgi:predicted ester cyclase